MARRRRPPEPHAGDPDGAGGADPDRRADHDADPGPHIDPDLPAGDLEGWLQQLRDALRGEGDAAVPCAGCTACCTSSQFVLIGPDEADTLAHVPAALRFPAPGLPAGHVVLGYDDQGRCPMLVDGACSIYEHRPRTCRTYDCRVFAASGLPLDEPAKVAIRDRANRWRFTVDGDAARDAAASVRAAARLLRDQPEVLDDTPIPAATTQLAVLAVEVHHLFRNGRRPTPDAVREAILATVANQPNR
jgi:Fe-S-cluster containining protein